jgi:hypothetical protein
MNLNYSHLSNVYLKLIFLSMMLLTIKNVIACELKDRESDCSSSTGVISAMSVESWDSEGDCSCGVLSPDSSEVGRRWFKMVVGGRALIEGAWDALEQERAGDKIKDYLGIVCPRKEQQIEFTSQLHSTIDFMSGWFPLLCIQLFWLHGDTSSHIIPMPLELVACQTSSTLTWKVPHISETLDRLERDLKHLKRDLSSEQAPEDLLARTMITLFNLRKLRSFAAIIDRSVRRVVDVCRLFQRRDPADHGVCPFAIEVKDHNDLGAVVSLWPYLGNLTNIRFINLDFDESCLMSDILRQTLPLLRGLESVSISNCLCLPVSSLGKIVTGLRNLRRLQVFEVTGTVLSPDHLQVLAAVIQIPSLTTLSLREASIDNSGAQALATALRGMTGPCALEMLQLSDNLLGREGAAALISVFQEKRDAGIFPSFNSLDLTQDDNLTFDEMVELYGLAG